MILPLGFIPLNKRAQLFPILLGFFGEKTALNQCSQSTINQVCGGLAWPGLALGNLLEYKNPRRMDESVF